MHNKPEEREFEELLRASLQEKEGVPQQHQLIACNNLLMVELQRREQLHKVSLWFLPGMLHAVLLGLFAWALWCLLPVALVRLIAVAWALIGSAAGFALTKVGVRYFELKERLTIYWEKQ